MDSYRTHVFDLDGVVLASNASKSEAFFKAALPYGEEAAHKMVELHQKAGSRSRRQRWSSFFADILQREPEEGELDHVIEDCTRYVAEGVATATFVEGIDEYLRALPTRRILVSGIEDSELREIVKKRGLDWHFGLSSSVFGGLPGTLKSERLIGLVLNGIIRPPAVYYGDAQDDYIAATAAKMDFVFVSGYSEFEGWENFFANKNVQIVRDFSELVAVEPVEEVKSAFSH